MERVGSGWDDWISNWAKRVHRFDCVSIKLHFNSVFRACWKWLCCIRFWGKQLNVKNSDKKIWQNAICLWRHVLLVGSTKYHWCSTVTEARLLTVEFRYRITVVDVLSWFHQCVDIICQNPAEGKHCHAGISAVLRHSCDCVDLSGDEREGKIQGHECRGNLLMINFVLVYVSLEALKYFFSWLLWSLSYSPDIRTF